MLREYELAAGDFGYACITDCFIQKVMEAKQNRQSRIDRLRNALDKAVPESE